MAPSASFSSLFGGTAIVVVAVSTLGVVLADVIEILELAEEEDPASAEREYKNLTWVYGMDRQICPEGHILASRFFFLHTLMRRSLIFILFT